MPSRWSTALAAALAAACLAAIAGSASAGTPCGPSGYAYAGVQSLRNGHGVSAVLTSLATPAVESGHVAGWVGAGAPGEGPGGSDEWIQVGLNSLPGTGNKLYYEVTRPFSGTQYVELGRVESGRPLRVAVLEVARQPDYWRVWVNGEALSDPIHLPGSHGALTPMAIAESWDGGRPACNRYAYRFERVSVATAPGGPWRAVRETALLQDPGYRIARGETASFVASAVRPLPVEQVLTPEPQAVGALVPARRAEPARRVATARRVAASAPLRKGVLPAPQALAAPSAPAPAVAVEPLAPAVAVEPLASAGLATVSQPSRETVRQKFLRELAELVEV